MSAIKGHASQNRIAPNGSDLNYASVVKTDPKNRAGLDVLPKAVYEVGTDTAESLDLVNYSNNQELRVIKATSHAARVGDIVRITSGTNINMELSVAKVATNYIYLAGELIADPDGESFSIMRHITLTIDSSGNLAVSQSYLNVVDLVDGDMIDVSSTNIPASSSNPQEIVASLAANVKKIQVIEDVGEFIGLYSGAALSETLIAILPPGFTGSILDIEIAAGTRLSIRNMKNAAISTSTLFGINFLG